jgi:hypothetical protein
MTLTLYLPPSAKVRDVANALTVLFGVQEEARVGCVRMDPTICEIQAGQWNATYHFEGGGGCREMRLNPNPFWACAAQRLLVAFGGLMVVETNGDSYSLQRPTPKKPKPVKRMTTKQISVCRRRLASLNRGD